MHFSRVIFVCLLSGSVARGIAFDIDKIKNFIRAHPITTLSECDYVSYIRQGEDIACNLMRYKEGDAFCIERISYLYKIIGFIWYLYSLAVNKDQGFVDGVLILDDKDQSFHNFLYSYIRNVSKKNISKRCLITANPYGCARRSTHFVEDQKKFMQYGIDIRFIDNQKAQAILPGNKAHILFGRLVDGLTFIKLERYGLYYKDGFIGHVGGYLKLLCSKFAGLFVTKKDRPLQRKEYMPEWILESYKKIRGTPCSLRTIKAICAKNQRIDKCDALIKKINSLYDHTSLRYGNEVILIQNEIVRGL